MSATPHAGTPTIRMPIYYTGNAAWLHAELRKFSIGHFEPKITWKVEDCDRDSVCVTFRYFAKNVDDLETVAITSDEVLADLKVKYFMAHPEALVRWFRSMIMQVLAHELDEWLTYDGNRIRDPHDAIPYKIVQSPTGKAP